MAGLLLHFECVLLGSLQHPAGGRPSHSISEVILGPDLPGGKSPILIRRKIGKLTHYWIGGGKAENLEKAGAEKRSWKIYNSHLLMNQGQRDAHPARYRFSLRPASDRTARKCAVSVKG